MDELIVTAPAKINLALDIKGLLPDGYHRLEMLMQTIGVYDTIYLKRINKGIKLTNSLSKLPVNENNLAYQAASLLFKKYYPAGGIEMHLEKRIPIAAGLAGGSTDAAGVLRGINQLFQLGLSYDELVKLAAELGSDVPFCLRGGTAYAYERGDKLEQLPDLPEYSLVLVTPPLEVSTARIYQEYDQMKPDMEILTNHLKEVIKAGKGINWKEGWHNILEPVTSKMVADINEIKELMIKQGVLLAMMSGSGPSVFAITKDVQQAKTIVKEWPRRGDSIFATFFVKQDFKNLCRK